MTKEEYRQERLDPRWQKKRLQIMERDDFKCCKCEETKSTLNVHHKYYVSGRKPWQYPEWALSTLCQECHKLEHDSEMNEHFEQREGRYPFEYWEHIIRNLAMCSRSADYLFWVKYYFRTLAGEPEKDEGFLDALKVWVKEIENER